MAKKLPVLSAAGNVPAMTPNQFMVYKMKTMKAGLICRLGHHSLGFKGTGWNDYTNRFATVTELVVMREYDDLGWEAGEVQRSLKDHPNLKEYTLAHAKDNLQRTYLVEQALRDLPGHPATEALLQDCIAIRTLLQAELS